MHDCAICCLEFNHQGNKLLTGDKKGLIRFFKTKLDCENKESIKKKTETEVKRHCEAVRGIAIAPTDQKFATCSDDKTVRVWDYHTASVEKILEGHCSDVTSVDWL